MALIQLMLFGDAVILVGGWGSSTWAEMEEVRCGFANRF